ncbi:MAG: hypothetical protein H6636_13690 [Anaerolineales bacterium]|nr:hypothetical protein [Anaerolineales bacterium]
MPVQIEDVVRYAVPNPVVFEAATFAYHALTHTLANRTDILGDYVKVLMDELAEQMVIQWLKEHGKRVEPVVDKGAIQPDLRHEIWVTDIRGVKVRAAVHTFLSTNKAELVEILAHHSLSVDTNQMCGINISVVYWYQLREKPRTKLPSLQNTAIIGWASDKNFREKLQPGITSRFAAIPFTELRSMDSLLQFLV